MKSKMSSPKVVAIVKSGVAQHEKNMHRGKPLTKLKLGEKKKK